MKSFLILFALLLLFTNYTAVSQTQLQFGECWGAVVQNIRDMNLNRVYVEEFSSLMDGVGTQLEIDRRWIRPFIKGPYAKDIGTFLYQLSEQGYYTIDLMAFAAGGWVIAGNRNAKKEQQAREMTLRNQRNYQNVQRRERTQEQVQQSEEKEIRTTSSYDALDYINLNCNELCNYNGNYSGYYCYLINSHSEKDIVVTVQITSRTGATRSSSYSKDFTVPAQEKEELGCTEVGGVGNEMASRSYKIIRAKFANW